MTEIKKYVDRDLELRNQYFQCPERLGDALITLMIEDRRESYERTDFRELDARYRGFGGKGFGVTPDRFFEAVKQAEAQGWIEQEKKMRKNGDIYFVYRLTEDGKKQYKETIEPHLTFLRYNPEAAGQVIYPPEHRLTPYFTQDKTWVELIQSSGKDANLLSSGDKRPSDDEGLSRN